MARKTIKARRTNIKAATQAVVSRRTQNILDALDMTEDTRDQLIMLTSLLHTEDGVLMMDERAVRGLIRWLSLIDDNLQYIAVRIDPDLDPSDPFAAYASAA
ncbi:hypothetical protein A7D27_08885 [Pseudomonas sp. 1D4]|uniref:hypothetical protein n=1 Tax=Pseudomonas sp. 1D4 TaxID=1843691 RepID=UPI00084A4778|nr:hypothetical protein [Pseudomonas sp. 1D4]OEC43885.1 hypothetical protein A7D27_08885 [Pseudomonas sp. 1D4]